MWFLRFFGMAGEYLLALGVLAVAIMVGAGVFFRYVLNAPLSFTFEGSTLVLCWIVFLGAVIATLRDAHIGVDLLGGRLPLRVEHVLRLLREAVILATSLYLVRGGVELTLRARGRVPSLDIPNTWLYAALPIGFTLVAAISFWRLVVMLRGGGLPR